jgi:hypothetical protein
VAPEARRAPFTLCLSVPQASLREGLALFDFRELGEFCLQYDLLQTVTAWTTAFQIP